MKLTFLGTGGGRYATADQTRQTGGIVLESSKAQIHIDPGPGALVYSNEILDYPENTEAVLVTHAHLDHYSDAEPVIEQITEMNGYPGTIFANQTVLKGSKQMEKQISDYHKSLCQNIHNLNQKDKIEFKDLTIESKELQHNDTHTVGFKASSQDKTIGFWTDSKYSKNLAKFYQETDILVVNCLISRNTDSNKHTSISDIPSFIREIQPSTLILTHFGKYLLNKDELEENKEWLLEECRDSGTEIIFAEDNMEFPGNRSLDGFTN